MKRYLVLVVAALIAGSMPALWASENGAVKRLDESATVLSEILAAKDTSIPQDLLEKAHCVAVVPGMKKGDIMGHETMGEVVEVGRGVNGKLKVGDRVVIPFTITCGECEQCQRGNFSVCERTNRNRELADTAFGHTTAGLFGYTHLTGGYPGGQAEYLRVPFADSTPYQGAGRHPGREAAVPQRYFPDGLAGRRAMRHRAERYGRGMGLRSGRTNGDPQRDPARRKAGHRHRPASRAAVDGGGGRRNHDQFRGRQHRRAPQ